MEIYHQPAYFIYLFLISKQFSIPGEMTYFLVFDGFDSRVE